MGGGREGSVGEAHSEGKSDMDGGGGKKQQGCEEAMSWKRKGERERKKKRETEIVCVFVCVTEREREREMRKRESAVPSLLLPHTHSLSPHLSQPVYNQRTCDHVRLKTIACDDDDDGGKAKKDNA